MIAWFLDISARLAVLLSLKSESARARDKSKPSAIEQQNFEMQREYIWNTEVQLIKIVIALAGIYHA
jgi:hypothetical protein